MNNYLNKILPKKNEKNFLIILFCLFCLVLITRLLAIHLPFFLGNLPLAIDEAQYLVWSKELTFGYFSKPPFIAWIIRLNSFITGEITSVELRNFQPLAFAISAIFISLSSFEITQKVPAAIWSGFLFFLLPLSSFYSQFATTDAWLLFFWSISLYFFIKAIITEKLKWWLFCGITVGIGLLTKYSMIFFSLSAFAFLISEKKLFSKKPWVSFLISILVFAPNIFWNFKQNFPTIVHHAEMTNINQMLLLEFKPVVEFFFGQFVVFGPFLFSFFLIVSFKYFFNKIFPKIPILRTKIPKHLLMLPVFFSWPILLFVLCLSFFGETEVNWAAPASVGICLTITSFAFQGTSKSFLGNKSLFEYTFILSTLLHLIFLFCFILGPHLFNFYGKGSDHNINPFLQVNGYQKLAKIILVKTKEKKNLFIVAEDRGILANLAALIPSAKVKSWKKNSTIRHHWDLTAPLLESDLTSEFLLVVKVNPQNPKQLDKIKEELHFYFDSVKKINDIQLNTISLQEKSNQQVMLFWINENQTNLNL